VSEARASIGHVTTQSTPRTTRIAGIVTTAELLAAGWRQDQIRDRTRHGDLLALRRGIYAEGAHARKLLSLKGGDQLLAIGAAAALTGAMTAAVSHQSAAYLHKIDLVGRRDLTVHLTRPPGADRHAPAGVRLHTAELPAEHVTQHLGLPVTTAARTVVDLARTLPFRAGVVAADSALHLRRATKDELQSVLAVCSRWRGASGAADVIAFADGRSESPLESIARVVFRDCGLPPPTLQALVGAVDDVARVDFFWDRYRTIVEVDGALKYADPLRARAQLERDAWLRSLGYEVVHFTWDDIMTRPAFVATSIREAFRRGALLAAARDAAR
jgi:predicted transcriptional regulator of viral defense system